MADAPPISREDLARRLRAAREAAQLTQDQVAEEVGLSRVAVNQIESAARSVGTIELEKFAYLYGRAIWDFFAAEFNAEDTVVALFRAPVAGPDRAVDAARQKAIREVRRCIALARETKLIERAIGAAPAVAQTAPSYNPPPMTRKWDAVEQGQMIAVEERRRLGLGEGPIGNLVDLLQSQGVHAAVLTLPADVSGLTLLAPDVGPFVVASENDQAERKRFSFAHEYGHVLLDRARRSVVSLASERNDLIEVRANAFAAGFLMPEAGVREFVATLGKGRPSRLEAEVYGVGGDEPAAAHVEGRSAPHSQEIQMYDVVQVAHHFGVSRLAMLYRLLNLDLVTKPRFDELKAAENRGAGRGVAKALGLPDDGPGDGGAEFQARFLAMVLEAFRRDAIDAEKLDELASLGGVAAERVEAALAAAGLSRGDDIELRPGAVPP